MKLRIKSEQLLLCILAFSHIACGNSGGRTQVAPSNQMFDRQVAGQQRARDEKGNYASSVGAQTASSYSVGTTSPIQTATTIAAKPSALNAYSPSTGSSMLSNGILYLALAAAGSYILGPSISNGVKSLSSKKTVSTSTLKQDSTAQQNFIDARASNSSPNITGLASLSSTSLTNCAHGQVINQLNGETIQILSKASSRSSGGKI